MSGKAATPSAANHLYAAIDMGTNSFKLLITTAQFLPILRLSSPVILSSTTSPSSSTLRASSALRKFHTLLTSHRIPPSHTRHVATSALRHDPSLLLSLQQTLTPPFQIDVLSGEEEARLSYIGVLQFLPVYYDSKVLVVDIGGGSTEFVVGKGGEVLFGASVLLGHVNLTHEFVGSDKICEMREHIRGVVRQSGLVQELGKHGFEVVIGSSGTIRAIEKAVHNGYGKESNVVNDMNLFEGYKRDWKFSRGNLNDLVKRVCLDDGKIEREKVFKKRSEFILGGAVLLEEIFEMLRIEEMEVSNYSLCEGVIAEKLAASFPNYDFNANTKWRSVISLATRFNNKKKMKSAASSAAIAKEIFESVRKWNKVDDDGHKLGVSFDDKDVEYIEAACLLHSVGMITGKKGFHKQSYHIIMNGGHLFGYDLEEVKMIALLSRHHRKKFPKLDHHSLKGLTKEAQKKFRLMCAIVRVSIVLPQYISVGIQDIEVLHSQEGFKLVLGELNDEPLIAVNPQNLPEDVDGELAKEVEAFSMVFRQKLNVLVPPSLFEVIKGGAFTYDVRTLPV